MLPSTLPPPGWYADPWRIATYRWWDGRGWTEWSSGPPPHTPGRLDPASPTFSPLGAVLVTLGTIGAIFLARGVGSVFDYRQAGLATFVFYGLLFGGMASASILASRMFGTGSLVRDFGWRIRAIDPAWGVLALVASLAARIVFALVVGPEQGGGPTDGLRDGLRAHHDVLAVFLVAALLGAPLFEELVFRGVIQRGLTKVVGREIAIVGQGLMFGFYHVVGAFDLVTLLYVGTLSVIGIVFGVVADRAGRLGPTMIAHFLSNALAMALLLGTDIRA